MGTRYRSKADMWIVALLGLAAAATLYGCAVVLRSGEAAAIGIMLSVAASTLGLMAWVFFGTHYTLSRETLEIRSGPFRWQVPIANIKDVRPVRSLLSAPALSTDRLEIVHGSHESAQISPRDRERFLEELSSLRGAA
jgi:hypothetical protein